MLFIDKLNPGVTLWIETQAKQTDNVWKIFMLDREGLCQVEAPSQFDGMKKAKLLTDIEQGKVFKLKFSNTVMITNPVKTCAVEGFGEGGQRYFYEVFS